MYVLYINEDCFSLFTQYNVFLFPYYYYIYNWTVALTLYKPEKHESFYNEFP